MVNINKKDSIGICFILTSIYLFSSVISFWTSNLVLFSRYYSLITNYG